MKKNVSGQKIGAQMITASDGSAFTGSVTVYVTGDAGTQAAGSVGAGACTHEGEGYHTYAPAQAETNYDLVAFTFKGTGAINSTVQVFTSFPQTGDSYAEVTSGAYGLAVIEAQTDDIGAAGAGLTAVASSVLAAFVVASGTSDAGGSTTTMVDSARTEADTDYWKGNYIRFTSGAVAGQSRRITGFNTTTDTISFSPATTQAIGAGITYDIFNIVNTADSASVSEQAAAVRTELTTELGIITGLSANFSAIPGDVVGYTMTEDYAALAASPSLAEILFEIRALIAEKTVSGTTLTTKKLDGSTTAATYTLNSATAPTAITRST